MGLDLKPLVEAKEIKLEELSNKIIAIDAYNAIYQFLAIIRGQQGEHLMDSSGNITSHLSGLFYRNVNLLTMNIKLVYVFDGIPPSLKFMEIERRRKIKEEAAIKYQEALKEGRIDDAKKYAQMTSVIKDYMIDDAKKLLDLLGIPWIDAPSEGEATAAYLTRNNIAYASASQDYDSLLFGAKRLVRNLTISGRRKLPRKQIYVDVEPELIILDEVLNKLGVTREMLVDIGILIGTDFNPDGFKGIGPKKALKLIKEYKRLEDIPLEDIQQELKEVDYQTIRKIFLEPEVKSIDKLEFKDPNYDAIIEFLCKEHDFSYDRVNTALNKLKEASKKKNETLERWF
ncbi:MAG: flap endonuclease-1 [Candidatus Nitrosothermus koennekii]|nr:MAG: flap endonuclease-1 [Candidatus Nitrosothermus koennekii]